MSRPSWAGAADLLATVQPVLPGPEAALDTALLAAATGTPATTDLSGLWATPAHLVAAHTEIAVRRVETRSGRVPLSLKGLGVTTLRAERDGAVLDAVPARLPRHPRPRTLRRAAVAGPPRARHPR